MFRDLSRNNKQLSKEECIKILKSEKRGVLSVIGDEGYPYGTPMNHYYNEKDGKIYFHCGKSGHRIDSVKKDSKASFCVIDKGLKTNNDWVITFRSVVVFGKIEISDNTDLIRKIATELSLKFTDDREYIENEIESFLNETYLLVLTPEHICGKTVTEA